MGRIQWRMASLILLLGDVGALLLFVYIGQRDHDLIETAYPLWGVLVAAAPFLPAWCLVGWWLGAFQYDADRFRFLSRSLNTWLVAAPLGLLLRATLLERAIIPTGFFMATLGFGGMFVLGWRLLFVTIGRTKRRPEIELARGEV